MEELNTQLPTLSIIEDAHQRIKPMIHRTPVMTSQSINEITGASIFFKCENFQKVGAFKFRGACNAVFSTVGPNPGVATHSSGNHGQALALAARMAGCEAFIVMPENASQVKIEAVKGYGATIIFCEPTLKAREETLERVVNDTGASFIHPYNDYRIIAGQATAAKELIEDIPSPDMLIAPVGGGGLLSGTALTTSYLSPGTAVYGAEPKGADDAFQSIRAGEIIPSLNPDTICDGLLTSLGDKTFPIIKERVKDILLATDEEIIQAMRLIWERMKIIIEPSCAVPLASIMNNRDLFQGKGVGLILSGGNIDLTKIPF